MPASLRLRSRFRLLVEELESRTLLSATTGEAVPAAAAALESVAHILGTITPNDTYFGLLWGLHNTGQKIGTPPRGGTVDADIDAPEAWAITQGSRDIVVAIVDSGVDYTHPDLAANIWTNAGEIPGNDVDDDGNGFIDDVHGYDFLNGDGDPMDDNGHGTHVAGTIGALGNNGIGVAGINWNVQIMAVKFIDPSGNGSVADAIRAIDYITMMRRDRGVNVVVVNHSWGVYGYSQDLQDLYDAFARSESETAGILSVVAAGNENQNNDTSVLALYPATFNLPSIISVAATDNKDQKASFSNYGVATVDLGAPGVNIASTIPGGYAYGSGTSMAAPHVAGVAALLAAYDSSLTATQIKEAILASGDTKSALVGKTVTGKRLNAHEALLHVGAEPPTEPPTDEPPTEPPPGPGKGGKGKSKGMEFGLLVPGGDNATLLQTIPATGLLVTPSTSTWVLAVAQVPASVQTSGIPLPSLSTQLNLGAFSLLVLDSPRLARTRLDDTTAEETQPTTDAPEAVPATPEDANRNRPVPAPEIKDEAVLETLWERIGTQGPAAWLEAPPGEMPDVQLDAPTPSADPGSTPTAWFGMTAVVLALGAFRFGEPKRISSRRIGTQVSW